MVSIIVLLGVFVLIAVRQLANIRYQIWQVMLAGAFGVLVTRQISPLKALKVKIQEVVNFKYGFSFEAKLNSLARQKVWKSPN